MCIGASFYLISYGVDRRNYLIRHGISCSNTISRRVFYRRAYFVYVLCFLCSLFPLALGLYALFFSLGAFLNIFGPFHCCYLPNPWGIISGAFAPPLVGQRASTPDYGFSLGTGKIISPDFSNWPYRGTEYQTRGIAMLLLYWCGIVWGAHHSTFDEIKFWFEARRIRRDLLRSRGLKP